jgi:hypothetical protein
MGVMILAVVSIVLGVAIIAASLIGIVWAALPSTAVDSWGLGHLLASAFMILMVICAGVGAVFIAMGVGFLRLRPRARSTMLFLAAGSLVWVVLSIVNVFVSVANMAGAGWGAYAARANLNWVLILLVSGAIDLWLLFYLSRPHVKQAFGLSST